MIADLIFLALCFQDRKMSSRCHLAVVELSTIIGYTLDRNTSSSSIAKSEERSIANLTDYAFDKLLIITISRAKLNHYLIKDHFKISG